jgi:pimeloyl-ACP methyl ester carboxylesterase
MTTPTLTQVVQGTARLTFDSITGITNTVERMHETIARHPLPWSAQPDRPSRAHGVIAAGVYTSIRGINNTLGAVVDRSIGLVPDAAGETHLTSRAIRTIAALNGAFGDHLEATGNPLATTMCLMTPQHPLPRDREALAAAMPQASPHLVVLVHGLSLSELSWSRNGAFCIGQRLHEEQDVTPLYLRYNTGRHISTNGQEFAQQLEQLCAAWPVPIESLSLIGHSMGGLVIRSACWYAAKSESSWLSQLQRVVCLGTPHHGSVVAKAGHSLNAAMQSIPYTEPLAFGERRSAGIKDLRHGDLLDEDWRDYHPDESRPDTREVVPLLPNVEYYFAAATLGRHRHDPMGRVLGDLLVRLDSATGSHRDDLRHLNIKAENCRVFHEKNHFDLLDDARVQQQVLDWFRA